LDNIGPLVAAGIVVGFLGFNFFVQDDRKSATQPPQQPEDLIARLAKIEKTQTKNTKLIEGLMVKPNIERKTFGTGQVNVSYFGEAKGYKIPSFETEGLLFVVAQGMEDDDKFTGSLAGNGYTYVKLKGNCDALEVDNIKERENLRDQLNCKVGLYNYETGNQLPGFIEVKNVNYNMPNN